VKGERFFGENNHRPPMLFCLISLLTVKYIKVILRWFILLVWLINGLYCKLLNGVPRHQSIVARILGEEHAQLLTKFIGVGELLIFCWILSRYQSKWCAAFQIALIAIMNTIEIVLAPDLLLFGKYNGLFAILLMVLIYIEAFVLNDRRRNNYPVTARRLPQT
jgi:hypothetical protein